MEKSTAKPVFRLFYLLCIVLMLLLLARATKQDLAAQHNIGGLTDSFANSTYLPSVLGPSNELFIDVLDEAVQLTDRQEEILSGIRNSSSTERTNLVFVDKSVLSEGVSSIELNLFIDKSIFQDKDHIEYAEENPQENFTWFGTSSDPTVQGHSVIVVQNNEAEATVFAVESIYSIHSLGDGLHVVVQTLNNSFPEEHPVQYRNIDLIDNNLAAEAQTSLIGRVPVISVLVAFTPAAASQINDIEAYVHLAVDATNSTFRNSQVDLHVELAFAYETAYFETGDMATELRRIQNQGDGFMEEAHALRDTFDADIVVLMASNNYGYCGLASRILAEETTAFVVVNQECAVSNLTFAHEIGHLLGARHNPEVDGNTSPFTWGHGYYYEPGHWRTVMSYDCPDSCRRLPYWSNPDVQLNGQPAGTATTHNNARVLRSTSSTIANFNGSSVLDMVTYNGGIITAFSDRGVYFSPDGRNLGGGGSTVRVYDGSQTVLRMMLYRGGVLTAFSGGSVYFSPDGNDLGGGNLTTRVYSGTETVVAMMPYRDGVMTAFSNNTVYYSPDGQNLGGGGNTTTVYDGPQGVLAMIPYDNGVITAFSGAGIYFSPDGSNLGGGGNTEKVYDGSQLVQGMIPYSGGVLTAFRSGGIYFSPDGKFLGGGGNSQRVYDGKQRAVALIPYRQGIVTAFSGKGIYYSPDGQYLGGGGRTVKVYIGRQLVTKMIPYQSGIVTAFSGGGVYLSPDGQNLGGGGNTIRVYGG